MQVVVEINKSSTFDTLAELKQQNQKQAKKAGTKSIKDAKANFDEITTVNRDDELEEETKEFEKFINGSRADDKEEDCHHKGFSFQRAWCCLRSRRTS